MLLQIHDELVIEVAPGEWDAAEQIVRDAHGRCRRADGAARRADRPRRGLERGRALTRVWRVASRMP